MKKREFEYKIEYEVDKKSKKVTAVIPELNHVSSFGDSFAEAESNVKEAALGYIEAVMKEKAEMPKSLPCLCMAETRICLSAPSTT